MVDLHQQHIWINICWTEVLSWDWFECEMLRRIDLSIVSERRPSRLHHLSSQTSKTNWINTFQTSLQWSRSKIMRFSIVISFALVLLGNFLIIIDHKKKSVLFLAPGQILVGWSQKQQQTAQQRQPVGFQQRRGLRRPAKPPPRNSYFTRPNEFSNLSFNQFVTR